MFLTDRQAIDNAMQLSHLYRETPSLSTQGVSLCAGRLRKVRATQLSETGHVVTL